VSTEVRDYDPEVEDVFSRNDFPDEAQPTDFTMVLAQRRGVSIHVERVEDIYDEQHDIDLQQWEAYATNDLRRHRCIAVVWRLLDFQFITENTTGVLLQPREFHHLGTMLGETWVIDGVTVAPPPSGYVQELKVWSPDLDAPEDEQCIPVVDEDTILEIDPSMK
jgi:hypothetical protein